MSLPLKAGVSVLAAIAGFLLLRWGMGLFTPHAGIVALAIGALAYSLLRTVERLRNVYRTPQRRRGPPEG